MKRRLLLLFTIFALSFSPITLSGSSAPVPSQAQAEAAPSAKELRKQKRLTKRAERLGKMLEKRIDKYERKQAKKGISVLDSLLRDSIFYGAVALLLYLAGSIIAILLGWTGIGLLLASLVYLVATVALILGVIKLLEWLSTQ